MLVEAVYTEITHGMSFKSKTVTNKQTNKQTNKLTN